MVVHQPAITPPSINKPDQPRMPLIDMMAVDGELPDNFLREAKPPANVTTLKRREKEEEKKNVIMQ